MRIWGQRDFFLENKEYYIFPRVTGDKKFVDMCGSSTNDSKQQVRIVVAP